LRQDHAFADDRRPRPADRWSIQLDGEDITHVPTHKRNLGMVFQSLALFPHLTVGENIAYPLRIRGAPKEDQKKRSMNSSR
jgi:ABC-type Fe3+/spermidine/putrescine transport system ATPase subunit